VIPRGVHGASEDGHTWGDDDECRRLMTYGTLLHCPKKLSEGERE